MIKNYLKIGFRNLWRNKAYSLINILGLTIGITCSCLLFIFVQDELSFDAYHGQSDRIYRVVEIDNNSENTRYFGQTASALGPALVRDYPEAETQARVYQPFGHIDIIWRGERFSERGYYFVDSTFFEMFDYQFIHGDPKSAVLNHNSIVMTESTAKRFFGNENPIGEDMEFQNMDPMQVTAVVADPPKNSHIQFDILITYNSFFTSRGGRQMLDRWDRYGMYTYIQLGESANIASINAKIPEFTQKYWGEVQGRENFYLQPLEDIYLQSADVEFGIESQKGQMLYIYLFTSIGIFILVIASINYMNLATARSVQRSKEIGLRKVSGAIRWQLILQFLSESVILALLAFVLSLGLVDLTLPYFNEVAGKAFDFNLNTIGSFVVVLFALAFVIGLISGSYPAFYLSRLKPAESLKGQMKSRGGGLLIRQGLVVLQFSLSIAMIIATLVVYNQLNYINSKEIGFNKDGLLVIDINNSNVRRDFEAMKVEFGKIPGVSGVSVSSRVPGEWKSLVQLTMKPTDKPDSIYTYFMGFDEVMIDVYDFEILSGVNFSGNKQTDSTNVIINEKAAELLGWDDPIGKELRTTVARIPGTFKVIGVMKDFHFQSLKEEIQPMVIGGWSNPIQQIDYFSLKMSGADPQEVIAGARNVHEQFDNSSAMEYHFLDRQLQLFYETETRAGKLFMIGAGLTIFIACLGLFGLASFIIQRKVKEISVRKVLGASATNLFFLLSKSFAKQILIAFIIATPLSYFVMNNWLNYFAYKVNLGVGTFLISGLLALAVALISVSYRAINAALLNPADTLKVE